MKDFEGLNPWVEYFKHNEIGFCYEIAEIASAQRAYLKMFNDICDAITEKFRSIGAEGFSMQFEYEYLVHNTDPRDPEKLSPEYMDSTVELSFIAREGGSVFMSTNSYYKHAWGTQGLHSMIHLPGYIIRKILRALQEEIDKNVKGEPSSHERCATGANSGNSS